ncbi:MAG: malonyl-ACP O-methyltransferase BioC [Candidatus Margulisbacteria bacterium]|nr:malonyl-ACP O-methyltransferase BioC [Candidatus Margulisiibacteriota bacterium]
MLDKGLIKKNFSRCVNTYNNSAVIQVLMADKLVEMLQKQGGVCFENVLEVGAGTGLLTSRMIDDFKIRNYFANDIINNYQAFLLAFSPKIKFLDGDIEEIELTTKFDLIIANAVFQWIEDIKKFLQKIENSLVDEGYLGFTTFNKGNFKEINDVLGVSLNYLDKAELICILSERFNIMEVVEMEEKLYFDDFVSVLQHIKATGANNLGPTKLSKAQLQEKGLEYKKKYSKEGKLSLTYRPICVICSCNK